MVGIAGDRPIRGEYFKAPSAILLLRFRSAERKADFTSFHILVILIHLLFREHQTFHDVCDFMRRINKVFLQLYVNPA